MGENTKVQITFHRRKFSNATCDYLCSKLDADNAENSAIMSHLQGLTDESFTKLKVKEANELVKRILQAMVIKLYIFEDFTIENTWFCV